VSQCGLWGTGEVSPLLDRGPKKQPKERKKGRTKAIFGEKKESEAKEKSGKNPGPSKKKYFTPRKPKKENGVYAMTTTGVLKGK